MEQTTTVQEFKPGMSAATVSDNGCDAPYMWPIAGVFRNPSMTIGGTNGSSVVLRGNVVIDCHYVAQPMPGGVIIPPGAAAGGYINNSSQYFNYFHAAQGNDVSFFWGKNSSGGTSATVNALASEFIADSGTWTVLAQNGRRTYTASQTYYTSLVAGNYGTAAELTQAVVIPFAYTLQYYGQCWFTGAPTNTVTYTVRVNSATPVGTPTVSQLSTDGTAGCKYDYADSLTGSAGDYVDLQVVTGATNQATSLSSVLGISSSSNHTMIAWNVSGQTGLVGTTKAYSLAAGDNTSTTESGVIHTMTITNGCAVSNMWVTIAGTQTNGHLTVTLRTGTAGSGLGSITLGDTSVTGTVANGTSAGAVHLYTTGAVTISQGDTFDISLVNSSGNSPLLGSVSIQCN
jgi:hypothetical protein